MSVSGVLVSQGVPLDTNNPRQEWKRGVIDCIQQVAKQLQLDIQPLPNKTLECPITYEIMRDPVVLNCGHTFENTALAQARAGQTGTAKCPSCRGDILTVASNFALKEVCQEWRSRGVVPIVVCDRGDPERAQIYLSLASSAASKEESLMNYEQAFRYTRASNDYAALPAFYEKVGETAKAAIAYLHLASYQVQEGKSSCTVMSTLRCADRLSSGLDLRTVKINLLQQVIARHPTRIRERAELDSLLKPVLPSSISAAEWATPQLLLDKLPPYPKAMQDFLDGLDPFDPTKNAKDTHFVVPLIKSFTIDGVEQPRTLKNLDALDKQTGGVGCRYIWGRILDPAVDQPTEVKFEWAVMTKDVVPGSRNQSYPTQKGLVEAKGYEVPGFLDAVTCILWEHRRSRNRLFNTEPCTYTRCKEAIEGWQLVVGGFAPGGLHVNSDYGCAHEHVGVAGLRKF